MTPEDEKELLRLLDLDYERTTKFIEGLVGTSATIRGWAVTIWLAILGIAVSQSLWQLGALAALAVLVFGVVDLYHSRLYQEAETHAISMERISGLRYKQISRGADDKHAALDALVALRAHRFGLYHNLEKFAWRWDLIKGARPQLIFRAMYPFMAIVGILVALMIAVSTPSKSSHPVACASPTSSHVATSGHQGYGSPGRRPC